MTKMEIRGTIFERLADMDEIIEFGICEDRKIYGGEELGNPEYVAKLLSDNQDDGDFIFLSAPLTSEFQKGKSYVARFIKFRSIIHKNMWIAEKYKYAGGMLHEAAQKILN